MAKEKQALSLNTETGDGKIEIKVTGQTDDPVRVSYELAVTGRNKTHHSGSTLLKAGPDQILSTVVVKEYSDWCATLDVRQSDGIDYQLNDGPCPA